MRNAPGAASSGHKRKARPQSVKSPRTYRVTGTWPDRTGRPARYEAADKPAARRIGRSWAEQGAHVVIEEHVSFGTYRIVTEYDGPALIADRAATQRATQEAADTRVRAELAARAAQRRAEVAAARDRAQAAALMVQPPVPRNPTDRRARHTAGGR
jgi:hypothetical protein